MKNISEINGDLISLARQGKFDVVVHGCNCMCTMGAGIAPKMAQAFGCDKFYQEDPALRGDVNKLGQIDYENVDGLFVVNAYTQYGCGINELDGSNVALDYDALTLCLRKMNKIFKGNHIGLPKIGCGLAGGDWDRVKSIITKELRDCPVTIVHYV